MSRGWIYRQLLVGVIVAQVAASVFHGAALSVLRWAYPTGGTGLPDAPLWLLFFQPCLFFVGIVLWARPIGRYLAHERPELLEPARRRFHAVFAFLAGLWAASFAVSAMARCWWLRQGSPSSGLRAFLVEVIAPGAFATYYKAYFTVVFLEPQLFRKVVHRLYPGDAIFERKPGPIPQVRWKLFFMLVNLVLLPMLLMQFYLMQQPSWDENAVMIVVVVFAFGVGYSQTLYEAIVMPLAELNKKMARVAAGDYGAKTIVLADDEIGTLKAHFNDMVDGLAERERLKDTFGRYVSVEIAKRLIESGKLSLGGESIEATILFSDIRDFTPLSETLSPQDLVGFLNGYLAYVTEPIAANNGVVNKFIGDAVMAIFAPQFGSTDHVADAVRAAQGMRAALARFNASGAFPRPVRFGVGLHTGTLVAGNIGTEKRMEYTVIGDTVNIAARIESQNKALDSTILLSEAVYAALDCSLKSALSVERCEDVHVKGKERALTLYKLLEPQGGKY